MTNKPMEVFIDAEWNGYRGDLISMAMVAMDEREFYRAFPLFTGTKPWEADNVIPVLRATGTAGKYAVIDRKQLPFEIAEWLAPYDAVHLIADWPEDIERFCRALITGPGMRADTPPLTMEVRRDLDSSDSEFPHNALADARAIRDLYLTMMGDV